MVIGRIRLAEPPPQLNIYLTISIDKHSIYGLAIYVCGHRQHFFFLLSFDSSRVVSVIGRIRVAESPPQVTIHIYICVCIYIYIYIYIYTICRMSVSVCINWQHICLYVSIIGRRVNPIYIYIYMYVCMYVYTHTHTHIHIHIYIHSTFTNLWSLGCFPCFFPQADGSATRRQTFVPTSVVAARPPQQNF